MPARRILIVDDEPALLRMMGLYLARVGYQVTSVATTDAAWAAVSTSPGEFAAAILDATMTGLSTEALALKLLAADGAVSIVVTSGYPVDMTAVEQAGGRRVGFVLKPFTAESLTGELRRLIGEKEEGV